MKFLTILSELKSGLYGVISLGLISVKVLGFVKTDDLVPGFVVKLSKF